MDTSWIEGSLFLILGLLANMQGIYWLAYVGFALAALAVVAGITNVVTR